MLGALRLLLCRVTSCTAPSTRAVQQLQPAKAEGPHSRNTACWSTMPVRGAGTVAASTHLLQPPLPAADSVPPAQQLQHRQQPTLRQMAPRPQQQGHRLPRRTAKQQQPQQRNLHLPHCPANRLALAASPGGRTFGSVAACSAGLRSCT